MLLYLYFHIRFFRRHHLIFTGLLENAHLWNAAVITIRIIECCFLQVRGAIQAWFYKCQRSQSSTHSPRTLTQYLEHKYLIKTFLRDIIVCHENLYSREVFVRLLLNCDLLISLTGQTWLRTLCCTIYYNLLISFFGNNKFASLFLLKRYEIRKS